MYLRRSTPDDGFTLVELMMTTLIMGIVITVAGSVLYSLGVTANRNGAMVRGAQSASTVMTQLGRDIRSAQAISFPTGSPSTEVQFADDVVSAGAVTTTNVLWAYSGSTLSRSVEVGGTFQPTAYSIGLANTADQPVFQYFTFSSPGTPLPATDSMFEFSKCTTYIGVRLRVAATTDNFQAAYQESSQVALTNELDVLTAPGNGYCL